MEVSAIVKPQSLVSQLEGKPQEAIKERTEECTTEAIESIQTPQEEAQSKIDLLV